MHVNLAVLMTKQDLPAHQAHADGHSGIEVCITEANFLHMARQKWLLLAVKSDGSVFVGQALCAQILLDLVIHKLQIALQPCKCQK